MTNKFPKINYIGNKEKIAEWICDYFPKHAKSVFDAFSGGGSISYQAKKNGLKVISNDILKVNQLLSVALVENNTEVLTENDVNIIFTGKPIKGFMFKNYSNTFFHPEECMELDLYRRNIDKLNSKYKVALAFTLLRRSMVRKMPYSRFNIKWDKILQLRDEEYSYVKYKRKRSYHNQSFKSHFLENLNEYNSSVFNNNKENVALNDDVFNLLDIVKTDIIYIDPPYTGTMNNYFGFYGLLDDYFYSKKKTSFGNNFIEKSKSIELFDTLFSKLGNFKYWFLSYNNSSYPSKEQLVELISKYSKNIQIIEKKHNYKITGSTKKNMNTEYLFIIKNSKLKK